MPRLSVSISDEQESWIEEKVDDGGDYESKSAFVRECLNRYERVDELEVENDDLRRQLQAVNSRADDIDDLANYVEDERDLQRIQRRKENAPIWKRIEWKIFGYDE